MDAVPVIARGHNVAAMVPPVPEAFQPLLQAVPKRPILILASDLHRSLELARSCGLEGAAVAAAGSRPSVPLPGSTPVLVVAAADALDLLTRSNLDAARISAVVLAWPEELDEEGVEALGSVMAECDRDAQRLLLTARSGPETDALVGRYALKAMTYGFPPAVPGQAEAQPARVGPARYVVAPASRLTEWRMLVGAALDSEGTPVATCPISREEAAALSSRGQPILVLAPYQLRWARTLFSPLTQVALPGADAGTARRTSRLRSEVSALAEAGDLDRELLILAPLLERFDSAMVAAAALRLAGSRLGPPSRAAEATPAAASSAVIASYARLWVGIGRKDGAKPGDLVGALVHEAKLPPEAIGRVELRDLFSLVEVRSEFAEPAVKGLTGTSLRGRRLVARVDRGPGRGAHRPPRRV